MRDEYKSHDGLVHLLGLEADVYRRRLDDAEYHIRMAIVSREKIANIERRIAKHVFD